MRPGIFHLGRCFSIALGGLLVGCSDPDPIQQYTVARQRPDDTSTPASRATATPMTPRASEDSLPFTFARPEGWKDAPLRMFQIANFTIGESPNSATFSVSTSGGGLMDNVNRWRRQVGLSDVSESEINADAKAIPVDGVEAKYFVVEGGERSILGVIAQRDGTQWFLKADGPKSIIQQEREKFETFVKSIRFK